MDIIITITSIILGFFFLTFIIYFYNLDMKLLQALYKPMMKKFNNMERDRKI